MHLSEKFSDSGAVLLKCIFYYFKVLGVAPLNFNMKLTSSSISRWIFSRSRISILYSLLLCSSAVAWNYTISFKYLYRDGRSGIINTAGYSIYLLGNTSIILFYCIEHEKAIVLLARINNARELIHNANCSLGSTKLENRLIILWITNILLFSGYYVFTYINFMDVSGALFVFSFHHLIPNSVILQYCMLLKLIENMFSIANENFAALSKSCTSSVALISQQQNEFDKELSQFWDSYSVLREIIHDTANFYSFAILLSIGSEFLTMILSIYAIATLNHSHAIRMTIFSFYELIVHLYPLLLLTTSVTNIVNQNERTSTIVNDCLKYTNFHQMILDKLTRFSIYLLHSKIKISIYSVFSLDNSLLIKIIGTMTTYLVILVQVQPDTKMPYYKPTEAPTNFSETSLFKN